MIRSHNKPKRRLEANLDHISFNGYGDPGEYDGNETPVIEWVRRDGQFIRSERPLIDGYYIDHDRPDRTRQTTARKALLEALTTPTPDNKVWINGLTNVEIIRLLSHQDYYQLLFELADDEQRFTVSDCLIFCVEDDELTWEEGDDFEENHLKHFPSKSPGGVWCREECDECWCTGVEPTTEKRCRACSGTGFRIE